MVAPRGLLVLAVSLLWCTVLIAQIGCTGHMSTAPSATQGAANSTRVRPAAKSESPPAAPTEEAAKPKEVRTDLYGDPLPPGALARLGTARFRHDSTASAYSPDGKVLASGGSDNVICLFDASTGKELRRLAGHLARTFNPPVDRETSFDLLVGSMGKGAVTSVAFSPDGKTLAPASRDGRIALWDAATGKELGQFQVPEGGLCSPLAFAPDGKGLVSAAGGAVLIWGSRFVFDAPGSSRPKSIGFGE
jgi:WD40 repeat protein